MAHIDVTYTGSRPLYAVFRRTSDAQTWNGSGFEPWADGNIGAYAVALVSDGGALFTATVPADLPAGQYRATVREQAGSQPSAAADLILRTGCLRWSGTAI